MEDENWPKYEKRNWPTGSLERQLKLNYPGCKNLNEAIQVQRLRDQIKAADQKENLRQDDAASQTVDEKPNDIEW